MENGLPQYLKPSDIRFTQDSIAKLFKDGRNCNDVIREMKSGRTDVNDIPRIKVAAKNGKYYSPNNRRLYVFRALEYAGEIETIPVKMIRYENIKFQHGITSKNDGKSVKMRGESVLPHSIQQIKDLRSRRRSIAPLRDAGNRQYSTEPQIRSSTSSTTSATRSSQVPQRSRSTHYATAAENRVPQPVCSNRDYYNGSAALYNERPICAVATSTVRDDDYHWPGYIRDPSPPRESWNYQQSRSTGSSDYPPERAYAPPAIRMVQTEPQIRSSTSSATSATRSSQVPQRSRSTYYATAAENRVPQPVCSNRDYYNGSAALYNERAIRAVATSTVRDDDYHWPSYIRDPSPPRESWNYQQSRSTGSAYSSRTENGSGWGWLKIAGAVIALGAAVVFRGRFG